MKNCKEEMKESIYRVHCRRRHKTWHKTITLIVKRQSRQKPIDGSGEGKRGKERRRGGEEGISRCIALALPAFGIEFAYT